MYKIKFKTALASIVFITAITSCNDNLNQFPSYSIEKSQSFITMEDGFSWNNGLYSELRDLVYGTYTYNTDIQADQLNATLTPSSESQSVHRWTDFLSTSSTVANFWIGYYSALKNINTAIEGLPNIKTENAEDSKQLDQYIGDAYLARAFCYHRLVLRFAKAYNPTTANSDLGVPLVLEYDINAQPPRSTVKQVYEQILSDIQEAKTRLYAVNGAQGAITFNADVVLALEARVKFYMQDWLGAKAAADKLINSGKYPLITTQLGLQDMWKNDFEQEVIMQSYAEAPNELPPTNNIYLRLIFGTTNTFAPNYIPSQWVIDMYSDADYRKVVYFDSKDVLIQGTTYNGIVLVNKYPGNPKLFTNLNTNYAHAPKVFRIAEMYLIAAEAAAKAGGDALTPLNALRKARNLPAITATATNLLQEIEDERFRELAFEGFRLDDLKRLNKGFTRRSPQNTSLINTGPLYNTLSKEANDPKFVWAIPNRDVTINPNIEQNPGW